MSSASVARDRRVTDGPCSGPVDDQGKVLIATVDDRLHIGTNASWRERRVAGIVQNGVPIYGHKGRFLGVTEIGALFWSECQFERGQVRVHTAEAANVPLNSVDSRPWPHECAGKKVARIGDDWPDESAPFQTHSSQPYPTTGAHAFATRPVHWHRSALELAHW